MTTNLLNNNTSTLVPSRIGRSSKTARKFTGYFAQESLPQAVSVQLDWLSFSVEFYIPEPVDNQPPIDYGNNIVLVPAGGGSKIFYYKWDVIYHGEHIATVLTHGRNEKIMQPGIAKLEVLNHLLYSTGFMHVISDVVEACNMRIRNCNGLHIAIDGANHVHQFLNDYISQNKNWRKRPELFTLGTWHQGTRVRMKGKARLDPKVFNKRTGMCDNFKIGSARKSLVVYNKTTELTRSHKEYIRQSWERAGIDTNPDATVWRCELRMGSESVKEIQELQLDKLNDPYYLLQILKTQCKNFFEFVLIEDDTNVSRARVIDLFQFEKLRVPLLEKIPRAVVDGAYKAQMSIHNAVKNIRTCLYRKKEQVDAAIRHIQDNVELYNLDRWFQKKLPEWEMRYIGFVPEGDINPLE